MEIKANISNLMGSVSYIVSEGDSVIVIDPNGEEEKVLCRKGRLFKVPYILLTHEHCDHCVGAMPLKKKFNAEIIASKSCAENLLDERMNYSRYFEALASVQTKINNASDVKMDPFILKADLIFENEKTINWQGHSIYLRETPGHSKGSICIIIDGKYLFSGDSLIWNEKTITRFLGGSKKDFEKRTLPWLYELNPETHVFPGHLEEFKLDDKLKQAVL